MKIKQIFFGILCGAMTMSCTDYLDVSPDSGLAEEEIFTSYGNTLKFFNTVYNGDKTELNPKVYNLDILSTFPLQIANSPRVFTFNGTTDHFDFGRGGSTLSFKRGSWGGNSSGFYPLYNDASNNNFRPIFRAMFSVIRTCNTVLMNLDRIEDANSQKDIEDIRGQAYFVRAYAHFVLGTIWGPFPYITDIMTPENFDRPRLSAQEYYKCIADDCDKARQTFEAVDLMRRDPGPGKPGHLQDPNQNKPTGIAALALKSRALLYRASPLSNPGEDRTYWEEAAEAAIEALKAAKQYDYDLLPWSEYYNNFYSTNGYTNEHLWTWVLDGIKFNSNLFRTLLGSTMISMKDQYGEFPTQNLVDLYDTADGDMLVTEEDRRKAEEKGTYNDKDPYANRDPRFAGNIFYNQRDITWSKVNAGEQPGKFNCYYTMEGGKEVYSTFAQGYGGKVGDTVTGYVARKRSGDWHAGKPNPTFKLSESLFRMVELYLNYAEAANEAYGGPDGKSPSSDMTALEALNIVRRRVSEKLVLDKNDPTVQGYDAFKKRVQKERAVEFDQEGYHWYFDMRRWKIASEVMTKPLMGVRIKQVNKDATEYSERFEHELYELPENQQPVWHDEMYFWPFRKEDYFKYQIFDTSLNPYW